MQPGFSDCLAPPQRGSVGLEVEVEEVSEGQGQWPYCEHRLTSRWKTGPTRRVLLHMAYGIWCIIMVTMRARMPFLRVTEVTGGMNGSWTGRKGDEGIVHRRCRHDIWLRTQLPGMSLALPKLSFSPPNIVSCICISTTRATISQGFRISDFGWRTEERKWTSPGPSGYRGQGLGSRV